MRSCSGVMAGVSSRKMCVSREHLDGMGEQRPFVLGQLAGAQALRVDAGLLGDQALDHLLVGHFQREDGHMLLVQQGGVLGHREQEAGLALARATGDDQQVGGLQAAQHAVQVDEAGRDAEDLLGALGKFVDAVVVIAQDLRGWAARRGAGGAR